jgi:hypothetical protein
MAKVRYYNRKGKQVSIDYAIKKGMKVSKVRRNPNTNEIERNLFKIFKRKPVEKTGVVMRKRNGKQTKGENLNETFKVEFWKDGFKIDETKYRIWKQEDLEAIKSIQERIQPEMSHEEKQLEKNAGFFEKNFTYGKIRKYYGDLHIKAALKKRYEMDNEEIKKATNFIYEKLENDFELLDNPEDIKDLVKFGVKNYELNHKVTKK